MAYITTAQADDIIQDTGNTLGWGGLREGEKEGFVQRASNRLEVIPFISDDQGLSAGGYHTRPRFVNGFKSKPASDENTYPIEPNLAIAVAQLALFYARNPNQGYHQLRDFDTDRSPLRDLPIEVRNALLPYLPAPLKNAEQVDSPDILRAGTALAFTDSAPRITSSATPGPSAPTITSTDQLPEGQQNLYFTKARASMTAQEAFKAGTNIEFIRDASGTIEIVGANPGDTIGSTNDLTEGNRNLYFTNARARGAFSFDSDCLIEMVQSTGLFRNNLDNFDPVVMELLDFYLLVGSSKLTKNYDANSLDLTIDVDPAQVVKAGSGITRTIDSTGAAVLSADPGGAIALGDLSNVTEVNKVVGSALAWNGSQWAPAAPGTGSGGGGGLTFGSFTTETNFIGVDKTSATVPFFNASGTPRKMTIEQLEEITEPIHTKYIEITGTQASPLTYRTTLVNFAAGNFNITKTLVNNVLSAITVFFWPHNAAQALRFKQLFTENIRFELKSGNKFFIGVVQRAGAAVPGAAAILSATMRIQGPDGRNYVSEGGTFATGDAITFISHGRNVEWLDTQTVPSQTDKFRVPTSKGMWDSILGRAATSEDVARGTKSNVFLTPQSAPALLQSAEAQETRTGYTYSNIENDLNKRVYTLTDGEWDINETGAALTALHADIRPGSNVRIEAATDSGIFVEGTVGISYLTSNVGIHFTLTDRSSAGTLANNAALKIITEGAISRLINDRLPDAVTKPRVYAQAKSILVAGSNTTLTLDDTNSSITIAAESGGGGGGGWTMLAKQTFNGSESSKTFTGIPATANIIRLLMRDVRPPGNFRIRPNSSTHIDRVYSSDNYPVRSALRSQTSQGVLIDCSNLWCEGEVVFTRFDGTQYLVSGQYVAHSNTLGYMGQVGGRYGNNENITSLLIEHPTGSNFTYGELAVWYQ